MDGTPARHLHAQIWLDKSKTKGSIKTTLNRICNATIKDWSQPQERVLNQGVKFAYNDNFYQEYLLDNDAKPEPVNIVYDSVPLEREKYYPSQEQQKAFQSKTNAVDKKYHHYQELYNLWAKEMGYPLRAKKWMVWDFMNDALYKSKSMVIPKDDKTIKANITHLYRYINGHGLKKPEELREQKQTWLEMQAEDDEE